MRRRNLIAAALLATLLRPAQAGDDGAVILTLTGKIGKPNAGDRATFDMAMLEQMPQVSFRTATPWYVGARKFTGPLLRDVLAAAGASGTRLRAIALNDYAVDIPVEDALHHDVIVARLLDDKPMTVREKGPLFIIYPFDTDPVLRNAVYFSRSAWQLKAIRVQ